MIRKARKTSHARTSLADDVYERLLQEITEGVISPGEYLSELRLVQRFDASRTPIREALIKLHKEGLVQKGPHKGYAVTEVSLESVREQFQLRLILEPAAARMAASNAANSAFVRLLDEIEQTQRKMEEALGDESDHSRSVAVNCLDVAFHVNIANSSGNKKLAKIITEVMNQFRRFHADCYVRSPWLGETCQEHRKIVEAIRSRNPKEAEQAMMEHIRRSIGRAKELSLGVLGGSGF